MVKVIGIALALMLAISVGAAMAEEIQGTIKSVDEAARAITLDDGTQVWVAEGIPMDKLKEGASVKASYEERDGKKVATSVEVE